MSPALLSQLINLQQRDYLTRMFILIRRRSTISDSDNLILSTVVILISVGYDYGLTFSREIKYVWTKSWTWVSTLFVLVRYCGLYHLAASMLRMFDIQRDVDQIVTPPLEGSSFLPGPAKCLLVDVRIRSTLILIIRALQHIRCLLNSCKTIFAIRGWALLLFLGAADFTMILRVWAMYNRSRLILVALLALFSLEVTAFMAAAAVHSVPRNMVNGTAVCLFAVAQFVKESLQMYRGTRRWQLNQYVNLLVKQGILYFFAVFLFSLINLLSALGMFLSPEPWKKDVTAILQYVPMFTLTPRFIISIRELYARDVQRRRGEGIDTGFGFPSHGRGGDGTGIVFADRVEEDEGTEDIVGGLGAP
ncbi:hypothetical protein HD554DRAFT_2174021 [Boletus coccyginus]|nr:hypothetical protein HD554DRAFT_2174021 [Boletus coccyginus]